MIKLGARLQGAWVEEVRDSQRLFFISKELQLNTKFHYMEVTATSENYKISLCISKITVKRKPFFTSAYTLSRQKPQKREKEREEERVRKRRGEGVSGREGKGERERREERRKKKWRKRYLKVFSSTPPPPNTFPSTVASLGIDREQHNSHNGGTREKHNSYKW